MKIRNWSLLITLSALACFFYFYVTPSFLHPAEDAAVLFNYAQNFKQTGAISYYIGGPHVDGNTDFLFMILVSLFMHVFTDAYIAALAVSALATMLTMFFIFKILDTKSLSLQYLALLLIFFSPQIWSSVLGFGTYFFAMIISWVIFSFWKENLQMLSITSFIAIMSRPEAIFVTIPLLWYILHIRHRGTFLRKIRQIALYFILPLLLYGIFRIYYFGQLLPTVFNFGVDGTQKVLGSSHYNSFFNTKWYVLHVISPGLLGLFLYCLKEKFKIRNKYYILIFSTILLPLFVSLLTRLELDYTSRSFIISYIGLVITICLFIRNYKSITLSVFGIILLWFVGKNSIGNGVKSLNHFYNNTYNLSSELATLSNLKIATSEPGILAWRSQKPTLDLWGINTPELSKRIATQKDIDLWNPDLIYLHANPKNYISVPADSLKSAKTWNNMALQVIHLIKKEDYLVFTIPYDNRNYKEDRPSNMGLLKSLLKFISDSNEKISNRQDIIAINSNSKNRSQLLNMVEKYGAKLYVIPTGNP